VFTVGRHCLPNYHPDSAACRPALTHVGYLQAHRTAANVSALFRAARTALLDKVTDSCVSAVTNNSRIR
jgi:hypothetical protein